MQTTDLPAETWDSDEPPYGNLEAIPDDLDAELEAMFAEGLTFERRPSRKQRREGERNVTRFSTMYRGQRRWAPTQVPPPIRIAAGRRRAKAARASRKRNRS